MRFLSKFNEYDPILEDLIMEKNVAKDKELWNQCVSWAKSKYDVWPSAYACGAAAKRYKSKGGKWKKEKKNESVLGFSEFNEDLKKWFDEKWVDISKTNPDGSHPPCGRKDADKGGYPKCRKVRVASKMSDKEKKNSVARKRRVESDSGSGKRKPNYSK